MCQNFGNSLFDFDKQCSIISQLCNDKCVVKDIWVSNTWVFNKDGWQLHCHNEKNGEMGQRCFNVNSGEGSTLEDNRANCDVVKWFNNIY